MVQPDVCTSCTCGLAKATLLVHALGRTNVDSNKDTNMNIRDATAEDYPNGLLLGESSASSNVRVQG